MYMYIDVYIDVYRCIGVYMYILYGIWGALQRFFRISIAAEVGLHRLVDSLRGTEPPGAYVAYIMNTMCILQIATIIRIYMT